MHIEVIARYAYSNSVIKTKAELKHELGEDPTNVVLVGEGTRNGTQLSDGVKYLASGPLTRKWYATIERMPDGTISVN